LQRDYTSNHPGWRATGKIPINQSDKEFLGGNDGLMSPHHTLSQENPLPRDLRNGDNPIASSGILAHATLYIEYIERIANSSEMPNAKSAENSGSIDTAIPLHNQVSKRHCHGAAQGKASADTRSLVANHP